MKMKWRLLIGLLVLFSSNGYATFMCYTVDKNNHFWKSPGEIEERACAVAMSFCTAHSKDGKSCKVFKTFSDTEQS